MSKRRRKRPSAALQDANAPRTVPDKQSSPAQQPEPQSQPTTDLTKPLPDTTAATPARSKPVPDAAKTTPASTKPVWDAAGRPQIPAPGSALRKPAPRPTTQTPKPVAPKPVPSTTTAGIIARSQGAQPASAPTAAPATRKRPGADVPTPKPPTVPTPAETKSPAELAISEKELLEQFPLHAKAEEAPAKEAAPQDIVEPPAPSGPQIPPMFVVMITPELAPVAKVGGLADVVFGLGRELEMRGNAVEIILPKYDCMRYDHIYGLSKTYENLWVPWFGGAINCSVWFGFVHGRKCFFIEPHSSDNFFNRGVIYGHNDDVMRFAFFSRAALEFMLKTNKHPDIIHCHDWQTALTPVLLYEIYQHLGMTHPRVCFTVHNFRHQGVTGAHVLHATGLNRPDYYFHYDRLRDNANPRAINLMKGGIVYSNFVTTVSPRHAWEAKDGGQGHGLEHTLHIHQNKYGGVLNGLDYDMFNPGGDGHIAAPFSADAIEKKYENKRALRNRFWLTDNEKPVVAFVGRLDPQKGLDLVRHAIFSALNNGAQFVLLGSAPDQATNDHFWGLKHHLNNSPDCHLEIGYNLELAHLIYAGADMMIVPSRYEPCGLTQLISMRYGTVPIVRSVGGLADTVFDKDFSHRPLHERNGYVFTHADNAGLESALHRAIACYYQFPDHFRNLMLNGMHADYSWKHPGQHYLNIYDYIRSR